jgi:aminoglycoside phosphotransferase (APT) family kinase protein
MLLGEQSVVPYLLNRGLIRPRIVTDGDVEVVDTSRRNRSFRFISPSGPSYLLKQGADSDGREWIGHEAAVYRTLRAEAPVFDRYLPRFHGYDPVQNILVLEYVRSASNLSEYHTRYRRFSVIQARHIGRALAVLHELHLPTDATDAFRPAVFTPWIFSVHRPGLQIVREISSANIQLIRIIQGFPELGAYLDALRREWAPTALIHGDIKWDNFIVAPREPSGQRTHLRIVDWELANLGDPCWDLGSVFHAYLSYWLLSIPAFPGEPPERFLDLALFPLEGMQSAMRAFWQSYTRKRQADPATSDEWLVRALRYGAARLLQTAYEQLQTSMLFTANIVCILQISFNILQRPHEASVQLLGIPARAWS